MGMSFREEKETLDSDDIRNGTFVRAIINGESSMRLTLPFELVAVRRAEVRAVALKACSTRGRCFSAALCMTCLRDPALHMLKQRECRLCDSQPLRHATRGEKGEGKEHPDGRDSIGAKSALVL